MSARLILCHYKYNGLGVGRDSKHFHGTMLSKDQVVDRTASVMQARPRVSADQTGCVLFQQVVCAERGVFENLTSSCKWRLPASGISAWSISKSRLRVVPADKVWLNGPYSETLSGPCPTASFKRWTIAMSLTTATRCRHLREIRAGSFDGRVEHAAYSVVNASAGDLSRDIVDGWTKQGLTVRDAYEKAATEELSAK